MIHIVYNIFLLSVMYRDFQSVLLSIQSAFNRKRITDTFCFLIQTVPATFTFSN